MINMIWMTLAMLNSMIFTQLNHPFSMTLVIIIQTFIVTMLTGLMALSFWFSYILFLVFLGGMLVLFIYITSLASNEMFHIPKKALLLFVLAFSFIILIFFFTDYSLWAFNNLNSDMHSLYHSINLFNEQTYMLTKLYNKPTNFITLMLMTYLLLTLIAIVKITDIFQGPLRQKN